MGFGLTDNMGGIVKVTLEVLRAFSLARRAWSFADVLLKAMDDNCELMVLINPYSSSVIALLFPTHPYHHYSVFLAFDVFTFMSLEDSQIYQQST